MAWQEPKDTRGSDPGERRPQEELGSREGRNSNDRDGAAPDLDQFFKKARSLFGGNASSGGNIYGGESKGLGGLFILVLGVILVIWLATGIYKVDAGEKGVELFLGKYTRSKDPGLTWRFPKPFGDHQIINIQKRHSQKITGDSGRGAAMMLTKDEAIVSVQIEVQYQIDPENPERFWFASIDPHRSLQEVVESAARERVGQMILDDVLTEGRERLTQEVKDLAQKVINDYGIGLVITNINLEDAQPPEQVQSAFSDAIRAREDEQARINEAETYRDSRIAEARGEVERELRKAEAYRDSKIAQAQGEADRYRQLLEAYKEAPEVTRERLYLETMEKVLERTSKIIMGEGGNNLMMLPISEILKGSKESSNRREDDNSVSTLKEQLPQNQAERDQRPLMISEPQQRAPQTPSRTGGQGRSGLSNRGL